MPPLSHMRKELKFNLGFEWITNKAEVWFLKGQRMRWVWALSDDMPNGPRVGMIICFTNRAICLWWKDWI